MAWAVRFAGNKEGSESCCICFPVVLLPQLFSAGPPLLLLTAPLCVIRIRTKSNGCSYPKALSFCSFGKGLLPRVTTGGSRGSGQRAEDKPLPVQEGASKSRTTILASLAHSVHAFAEAAAAEDAAPHDARVRQRQGDRANHGGPDPDYHQTLTSKLSPRRFIFRASASLSHCNAEPLPPETC